MEIQTKSSSALLKNALVIEDDPDLAEIIEVFFNSDEWKVWIAKDLKEADRLLKDFQFDLVLADYRLPDGLSLSIYDQVKTICPHFILMTGDGDVETFAKEKGVDRFIQKPFRRNQFQEILGSIQFLH